MTKPKHYLYSCAIQINTRGRVPVERKRYAQVNSLGEIVLVDDHNRAVAYTADSLEGKALENYRLSNNGLGLTRVLSQRKYGAVSLSLGSRALNEAKGCVGMIASQLERLNWLQLTIEQRLGVKLDCDYELGMIGCDLDGIKQAIEQAQIEAGISVRPQSKED